MATILLIPLLFAFIFGILGVAFIAFALISRKKAETSQSWPVTTGSITRADLQEHISYDDDTGGTTRSYEPRITYTYNVAGQPLTSTKIGFGANSFDYNHAQEILNRYPVGTPVTVHYDPNDPGKAVLETKPAGSKLFLIIGGLFVGIAVAAFLAALLILLL